MKESVLTGAAAVHCPYCGDCALSWAADRWLAAHEQLWKCGKCGRLVAGLSAASVRRPKLREISRDGRSGHV